jgi:hypothetical protein
MNKIDEFLKRSKHDPESIHDDIYDLLVAYIQQEKRACNNLLTWIPMLANKEMQKVTEKQMNCKRGIEELIHINMGKVSDEDFVPYSIHAVMEYFPYGNSDGASALGKEFFDKFVKCLKEYRYKLIDVYWSKEIVKCNDYLKLVLNNTKEKK